MSKQLKITLVKSKIGRPENQRQVLSGLGLNKTNGCVVLNDTPEVRGMINKVIHLVSVKEI